MKLALLSLFCFFAFAQASTVSTKSFLYNGSQSTQLLNLLTEKTHTEYRYEQRQSICTREVVVYVTVCSGNPPACYPVPQTRWESYPCIQTVSVPYQVKDYDVQADVNFSIKSTSSSLKLAESFRATLNGDTLTIDSTGTKNFFHVSKTQLNAEFRGSIKFITANIEVELVEANPVLEALAVNNMYVANDVLQFNTGKVSSLENVKFNLNVQNRKIIGSDMTIFDRDLFDSEVSIENQLAKISLKDLGIELLPGRNFLTVTVSLDAQGDVLNKAQFNSLDASGTLLYKIR